MTEQNASSESKANDKQASSQKEESKFVSVEAYREVSEDMHKYKNKLKETEAKAAELSAKLEAEAKAKLESAKNYETLYKQTQEKLDAEATARQAEREKFLEATKINALLHELGGVAKRDYIRHANTSSIELNDDGTINEASLKKEAERFRQEHFVLLKDAKGPKLPQGAPGSSNQKPAAKPFEKMSFDEKKEAMKAAFAAKKN